MPNRVKWVLTFVKKCNFNPLSPTIRHGTVTILQNEDVNPFGINTYENKLPNLSLTILTPQEVACDTLKINFTRCDIIANIYKDCPVKGPK